MRTKIREVITNLPSPKKKLAHICANRGEAVNHLLKNISFKTSTRRLSFLLPHPREHLGVFGINNSITAIDICERQLFFELRARVVSLRIFVRYQRLMARKIAIYFSFLAVNHHFDEARCFDELSRGSVLCLFCASFTSQFC